MKKRSKNLISLIALFAMLCIGYAAVSFGAPTHNIKWTLHNFGGTHKTAEIGGQFYSSTETEICIYCHTPHNAAAGKQFLWNRTNYITTFQMYTASPTLDFTNRPSAPSEVSKLCLTCHDGAGSINAMANPRANANMQGFDQLMDVYYEGAPGGFGKNIGEADTDQDPMTYGFDTPTRGGGLLVNDHPISFVYSDSQSDPTIKTPEGGWGASSIGGLPLWWSSDNGFSGYKIECVTCHDPHINYNTSCNPGCNGDAAYRPFLRKTMNSSSLCFTCHNK